MNPRREPLLWLQLVALGAIPLEVLLLLLLLAGADPGPLPGLERVLVWGLGVLAPGLLLWRRPADCGSLLLVQVPAGGRSPLLRHLNGLQRGWPPRILLLSGAALLLAGLWVLDRRAALAGPLTPLDEPGRLVTLVLAAPLLALLLWQWQQLGQALWLLSRTPQRLEAAGGETAGEDGGVLSLGLPLLLLPALELEGLQAEPPGGGKGDAASGTAAAAVPPAASGAVSTGSAGSPAAVAIEPEQPGEDQQRGELDQQID